MPKESIARLRSLKDMDQEAKGAKDRVKGKARENWGKLSGTRSEEAKGKIQNTGGKVRQKLGRAKRKAT